MDKIDKVHKKTINIVLKYVAFLLFSFLLILLFQTVVWFIIILFWILPWFITISLLLFAIVPLWFLLLKWVWYLIFNLFRLVDNKKKWRIVFLVFLTYLTIDTLFRVRVYMLNLTVTQKIIYSILLLVFGILPFFQLKNLSEVKNYID